jgi:isopenicillin-N N-acyltransferase like protein
MKKLNLKGTPHEIGHLHGEFGKKEVIQSILVYEKLFYGNGKVTWKKAKDLARKHLKAIERYDSELLEEMEGVAKGAGVDFEDILVLNARSEIALTQNDYDGCTSVGYSAPLPSQTWLFQNWDWKADQNKSLLFLEIEQENKPTVFMVTEGGIIGKIGMNNKGIGVCLNAIRSNELNYDKVPIHLGLRGILNSNTYTDSIKMVNENQIASAANFLIASRENKMIDIEVSPVKTAMIENKEGILFHTNHFCCSTIKEKVKDFPKTDSFERFNRMEKLVQRIYEEKSVGIDYIKEILTDHYNYPNSICRHSDENMDEHLQMETVFSIVMNLTEMELYLSVGLPCENKLEKIEINS